MRRFTSLFAILLMFSLGMGLSHALHHTVAHPHQASRASCGGGQCVAFASNSPASTDQSPQQDSSHHPDDCAVCATLASTKTLLPALLVSAVFVHAPAGRIAAAELTAPRAASLCTTRSRAPPAR